MESNAKRSTALNLLAATGMSRNNYAPSALRVLWRLGVDAPPPHFASFAANAFVFGSFFAVSYGLTVRLIDGSAAFRSPGLALLRIAISAVCFGVAMASYYAYGRRRYGLPFWRDLDHRGDL